MKVILTVLLGSLLVGCSATREAAAAADATSPYRGPIIDMHVHADAPGDLPPGRAGICLPLSTIIPYHDPREDFAEAWFGAMASPACDDPIWSPESYEAYLTRFGSQFAKHNVTAVASGFPETHETWMSRFSDRIIPSLSFRLGRDSLSPDSMKTLLREHDIQLIGEIANQYAGIAPNDPRMYPYYALAEELDVAVAIHLGSGSPGVNYLFDLDYSPSHSNPMLLEDVLKRFPKLRISVMHYGEPFIDELITMLYHYPQLYVDLGGIQWCYPREYFYEYHLKKLVAAGFGKRIMFGSDAFLWPELIEASIAIVNEADILTAEQKADIFYNNAARFLRLDENR
ncbi:hypothetical protein CLV84_1456 [Neolewinella xylanilytica]|uniref:Amidohydrolase-related domain-containing protein n=1 Tax=Neolewinella xylanilytica TaxID=1514080 RepID=A0A2S6IAH0_9BACT|nr:amidohydrolase family protein [Neolewinella xylanilytica]PPK88488.1 hypothetical protein CLV84_1456 [Neolewinella xylanilytica]